MWVEKYLLSWIEATSLDFLEVRPRQPGSPGFGKLQLGLFAGRGPANARALVGIDEHTGDRPAPTLAGRASDLFFKRADDGVAAHHGVLSGVGDGTIRLWNAATGQLIRTFDSTSWINWLLRISDGHSGRVNSVAFSPYRALGTVPP
jgi:hypothetical protein